MPASIPANTLEKFTTFGDLLRFLRRRMGITQTELAIGVGYSTAQISRLEQNLRLPDIPTIEARFISELGLEDEPKAVARLLDLAANVRREDAPSLGLCPYKGLNYFDEADADLFVGREALTAKLIERVLSLTLGPGSGQASSGSLHETRFLAVVGASGSGKSSLVRAGMVPSLRWNKTSADWQIHILTPKAHPLESLAESLTRETDSVSVTAKLMDDLARDSRSLHLFAKRELRSANNSRLLLVVDQFEELFALCRSEEERASFIDNLLTAASEADGPTVIIITLRADFYAHCANYPQLREALAQHQEFIGAMTNDELCRAIEEPARRGRWEFEPGLVDLLLHDVGNEPGALPLLSHALLETWQRRRGRAMTMSGYASSGGVRGAIAETAEAVFTDQFTREQQAIARRIFLRLTELGDETATGDTRRRATFNELILKPEEAANTQAVLKALADARLIITTEDSAEVSHEALIREWPTLRGWLEDNREKLRLHRHLTEAAQEWLASDREVDVLYRGARLTQAREWAGMHFDEMNPLEREFLNASIEFSELEALEREAQRQRELESTRKLAEAEKARAEEQAHAATQLRKRAVFLGVSLVLAIALAGFALFFSSQARQNAVEADRQRDAAQQSEANALAQKRIATSRELAATALANLGVDAQRSVLLALQAVKTTQVQDKLVLPEAEDALHRAVLASRAQLKIGSSGKRMWLAVYNPDGSQIATRVDGMIQLWDGKTGEQVLQIPIAAAYTTAGFVAPDYDNVVFSSDGTQLAIVDYDSQDKSHLWAKIFDAHSGRLLRQTKIPMTVDEWSMSDYSSDLTKIVVGSFQNTAMIWDTRTGELLQTLSGHQASVTAVAFSADGKRIVTTSVDGSAKVWDAANGKELLNLCCHNQPIYGTAFSPDGTEVATASNDRTIKIWDATTGKELLTLSGLGDQVKNVAFSPDGKEVAGASFDRTALVWNSETGDQLYRLAGLTDVVYDARFSPDGKHLVTASWDGSAVVWDAEPSHEVAAISTLPIWRSAINLDHTRLATYNAENKFMVWDLARRQLLLTFTDPSVYPADILANIAISPDGKRVSYSTPNAVKVWDVESGQQMFSLSPKTQDVQPSWIGVPLFSADGKRILANFDYRQEGQTVRHVLIWDTVSGAQLADYSLPKNDGTYGAIALSPDGTRLVSGDSSAAVRLFDAQTGEMLKEKHNSGFVNYVLFSPDGEQYISASLDGTAVVRDTATGGTLFPALTNSATIYSIDYSADGKYIATAGLDGVAKVWDANTGKELHTLQASSAQVRGAHFSANGTHLFTTGMDGVIREYTLNIEELVQLAKARLTRSLTTEECKEYLHVEQCPSEP